MSTISYLLKIQIEPESNLPFTELHFFYLFTLWRSSSLIMKGKDFKGLLFHTRKQKSRGPQFSIKIYFHEPPKKILQRYFFIVRIILESKAHE